MDDNFLAELLGPVIDKVVPLLEAVMVQNAAHVARVGALIGILAAVLGRVSGEVGHRCTIELFDTLILLIVLLGLVDDVGAIRVICLLV